MGFHQQNNYKGETMKTLLSICILVLIFSCSDQKETLEKIALEFRIAEVDPDSGLTHMTVQKINVDFYLHDEVLLNNSDIEYAEYTLWQDKPGVKLIMTDRGKEKWVEITEQNIGSHIGMVLNKKLVSAPIVRAKIDVGLAIIQGIFTEEEAKKIVAGLNRD
jgi:preprotein translocase subunit SecD